MHEEENDDQLIAELDQETNYEKIDHEDPLLADENEACEVADADIEQEHEEIKEEEEAKVEWQELEDDFA